MKKILAFGGSSSTRSINKQLAHYTAKTLKHVTVELIDLNDFDVPLFSIDLEKSSGIPEQVYTFKNHIDQADGLVLSLAEHNGSFAAAYKNIYDWVSLINNNVFQNKPLFLLATSPGGRGGRTVLEHAKALYGYSNKAPLISFSLPSFHKNFSVETGIIDRELKTEFEKRAQLFNEIL